MPPSESPRIECIGLPDFPMVRAGDELAELIDIALKRADATPAAGDILVVAQKVVSKAEGRCLDLKTIAPGDQARELAARSGKDPRLVEAILGESVEVLRCVKDTVIVRHKLGFVCANAAIDASNVGAGDPEMVLLLPVDPDESAQRLRTGLGDRWGFEPGVIINDSFGRAWRLGTIGTAIGSAGVASLQDLRGQPDLFGRTLTSTEVATADELSCAASLVQGQAAEGTPVVLIRGFASRAPSNPAAALVRPIAQDLFR